MTVHRAGMWCLGGRHPDGPLSEACVLEPVLPAPFLTHRVEQDGEDDRGPAWTLPVARAHVV